MLIGRASTRLYVCHVRMTRVQPNRNDSIHCVRLTVVWPCAIVVVCTRARAPARRRQSRDGAHRVYFSPEHSQNIATCLHVRRVPTYQPKY